CSTGRPLPTLVHAGLADRYTVTHRRPTMARSIQHVVGTTAALALAFAGIAFTEAQPAPAKTPAQLTAAQKAAGWRLLFDGVTTGGWRGFKKTVFPEQGWVVEDGCLKHLATTHQDSRGSGDIVTVDTFDNFDLEFEWRIAAGANTGVKYLVSEARQGPIAHEYQIVEDARPPDAKIGPQRPTD